MTRFFFIFHYHLLHFFFKYNFRATFMTYFFLLCWSVHCSLFDAVHSIIITLIGLCKTYCFYVCVHVLVWVCMTKVIWTCLKFHTSQTCNLWFDRQCDRQINDPSFKRIVSNIWFDIVTAVWVMNTVSPLLHTVQSLPIAMVCTFSIQQQQQTLNILKG